MNYDFGKGFQWAMNIVPPNFLILIVAFLMSKLRCS